MKDKKTAIQIILGIMKSFEISINEIYKDEKNKLLIVPKEKKQC